MNLPCVEFELDSQVVVSMVQLGYSRNAFLKPLLDDTLWLLRLPHWRTSVSRTFREGNRSVYFLANMGHGSAFGLTILDAPPVGLHHLLREDM